MWEHLNHCGDCFLLIALKLGRGEEPVPAQGLGGGHTTILRIPPASLDLVGGYMEKVAESECDRDGLKPRAL